MVGNLLSAHKLSPLATKGHCDFNLVTLGKPQTFLPVVSAVRLLTEHLRPRGVWHIPDLYVSQYHEGMRPSGHGKDKVIVDCIVRLLIEVLPGDLKRELLGKNVVDVECFLAGKVKQLSDETPWSVLLLGSLMQ